MKPFRILVSGIVVINLWRIFCIEVNIKFKFNDLSKLASMVSLLMELSVLNVNLCHVVFEILK